MTEKNSEDLIEEPIDWESPFDSIRSAEINDVKLQFLDNGVKTRPLDEKGEEYTLFKFNCIRIDMKKPKEVSYSTSSKRLIEELMPLYPQKNKKFHITRSLRRYI